MHLLLSFPLVIHPLGSVLLPRTAPLAAHRRLFGSHENRATLSVLLGRIDAPPPPRPKIKQDTCCATLLLLHLDWGHGSW